MTASAATVMRVFVGLDCGGSSSRALAVDERGEILFQGQSGAANLVSTPENRLRKNLLHATNGCPKATYVCGCFAGLISEDLRAKGEEHLQQLFPEAIVRAEPDYTAAFYASPENTDLCVIAGTGSLVCSRGSNGILKSGGRGYILGDFGSGYQYGRDALIHYLDDPSAASSQLRRMVHEVFETSDEGTIISAVYKAQTPAGLIAKLLKALAGDVRNGERYALESVERNSRALADVVVEHVRRHLIQSERLGISLAGGVWKAAPNFRERFAEMLRESLPDREIAVQRIARPPLYGAVELAKEMEMNRFGN